MRNIKALSLRSCAGVLKRNKQTGLSSPAKILRDVNRGTAVMSRNASVISQVQITAGAFMAS
jgi:hypothetical protein